MSTNPFTLAVIPPPGAGTAGNSNTAAQATLTVARGTIVNVLVSVIRSSRTCTSEPPEGGETACTGVITLSQTGAPAAWNACFPAVGPSEQALCLPALES